MSVSAIIVAAGKGLRAGTQKPKQYELICGKPMIEWSISAFIHSPLISQTVVVVAPDDVETLSALSWSKQVKLVEGGTTRTGSVICGLAALNTETDVVLIHDAARPGVDEPIISTLIDSLQTFEAAVPTLAVVDALKRVGENHTLETVNRAEFKRVQTPQAFKLQTLRRLMAKAPANLVDDLAVLEVENIPVATVDGSERYGKVTFSGDFSRMEQLLTPQTSIRVGTGFDVHAFEPGNSVTLCGVEIPHTHKLQGHSDADVGWHALTDAILGAAALGDIGDHFPPSDPQWKNVDSAVFLAHSLKLIQSKGWGVANCDITLICEAPKVKPHRDAMRARTAELTGLPIDAISIKATTTEQLGFTGRREGIAAQAIVSLRSLTRGARENVS